MKIGLICRQASDFDSAQTMYVLAKAVAAENGECVLITEERLQVSAVRLCKLATFFVAVNGHFSPVDVTEQQIDAVRIFTISTTDAVMFAAAAAGVIRKLIEHEAKPDFLHLFTAADVYVALVCQFYFRIPFLYSVRQVSELKQAKKNFAALCLSVPVEIATAGDALFVEQWAAHAAAYVLDETGEARWWKDFFCQYVGKYVEAKPFVDTTFWSDGLSMGIDRTHKRNEFLQHNNSTCKYIVACEQKLQGIPQRLLEDYLFLPAGTDNKQRRALYQVADFYLAMGKHNGTMSILSAMAAGCVPLISTASSANRLFEEIENVSDIGYVFEHEEWLDVLSSAGQAVLTQPEIVLAKRQRARAFVERYFSISAAVSLHSRVYLGLAPVRLPFMTEMQPVVSGIWEGVR